jgi:dihydrofolate reductase
MGRLVINNAFQAPSPDAWLVLDPDSSNASLQQFLLADAMVLGRETYQGLAAVWPQLVDDPTLEVFADRLNSMPKYVASRTLRGLLAWNATLLEGDLGESVPALKERHGLLIISGAGELARALTSPELVDEFWFWMNPYLWAAGPGIFDGVGPSGCSWSGRPRSPPACCGWLPASTQPSRTRQPARSRRGAARGACCALCGNSNKRQRQPARAALSCRRDRSWQCPRTPRPTTPRSSTPTLSPS